MQVVHPSTAQEVGELLGSAQAKGTRVGVRGGRTLEQILPIEGAEPEFLLDMSRMNQIVSIEKGNLLARVEAGAVTADVQRAVEAEGLFYPPDPSSLEHSTIGGNIACSAFGPRLLKYGGTRDFVLGLDMVLPTGARVRTGANMQKSVAGYDMTRFLIGSGSRFGVVTGAILRLLPSPQRRQTLVCAFPSLSAGTSVALSILRSGITPAAMELLDAKCVEVDREGWESLGLPWRPTTGASTILLIELDGVEASVHLQRARIVQLCGEQGEHEASTLATTDQASRAWELRRRLLPRLMASAPSWALAVAAVGRDQLLKPSFVPELSEAPLMDGGASIACFAHAGSGVLHLFVGINARNDRERDDAVNLAGGTLQRLRRGGVKLLHSYGPARRLLGEEEATADALIESLGAIQRSFDPQGIMV